MVGGEGYPLNIRYVSVARSTESVHARTFLAYNFREAFDSIRGADDEAYFSVRACRGITLRDGCAGPVSNDGCSCQQGDREVSEFELRAALGEKSAKTPPTQQEQNAIAMLKGDPQMRRRSLIRLRADCQ